MIQLNVLPCELLIKFSQYFDLFPQVNGNWNCGFTILDNKYYFLCRNEVSKHNELYWGRKLDTWDPRVVPVLAIFNNKFEIEKVSPIIKTQDFILSDVRAFNWNNKLHATGTLRSHKWQLDGKRRVDQFLARIIDDKLIFLPFEHSFPLPQKNWTPIIGDQLFFENFEQKGYKKRDLMVYTKGSLSLVNSCLTKRLIRGNCQSVDIGDYLLTVYHFHKSRYYYHYFALLEKDFPFNFIKFSEPFRFSLGNNKNENIQFIMGMEKKDDNILISYGVQDADNYLVRVKLEDIIELLI